MISLLQLLTVGGALAGALVFFVGMSGARGAPQEAAAAAAAVALAVIPYVLLRCAQLADAKRERDKSTERLMDALRSVERAVEKSQTKS